MSELVKKMETYFAPIATEFNDTPSRLRFKDEIVYTREIMRKNQKIGECTKESLLMAVLSCAKFNISLNPIQHEAYLVPFKNNQLGGVWEAVLMIGYRGIINKLAEREVIQKMDVCVVYEGDIFKVLKGSSPSIEHECLFGTKPSHVYAVATLPNGLQQFEVMTWKEVEEVRSTSISWKLQGDKSIWGKWLGEMAKKTVVRRLAKYLPKGTDEELNKVISIDDTDFKPDFQTVEWASQLLRNSTYDHDMQATIEIDLVEYSVPQIQNLITDLMQNQLPESETVNPNQKDIAKIVEEKIEHDEN